MKRGPLALVLAVACYLVSPSAASASTNVIDEHCSPSGDYCTSVVRSNGRVKLAIRTFSFTGDYELCVRPPGEPRECHTYLLTRARHGIYAGRIDFARQFSHGEDGRYAVTWHLAGTRLGRALHFQRG